MKWVAGGMLTARAIAAAGGRVRAPARNTLALPAIAYNSRLLQNEAAEELNGPLILIPLGAVALIVLILVLGSFFTVNTAQVAVITRFGKFLRVAEPGLNWKFPYFDSVAGMVSLRVNQISLTMETKTKDNVFVTIPISVQNRVRPEKVYDAYYKLSDPSAQIKSYVEQVILGHVPGMTLDEVFASQSSIAAAVKQELDADMATFGFEIVAGVLRTSIRGCDAVIRYGGDEFLTIVADASAAGAQKVVERMEAYLGEWNRFSHLENCTISLSIGVAEWHDGKTLDEVLDLADQNMYAKKARLAPPASEKARAATADS